MKRACVIGWPISHSRSPLIHRHWLKTLGLPGDYSKIAVAPENLADFIAKLERNGLAGCNVTLPHKEAVFALVTVADEDTARLGTVNTVFLRNGVAHGTNTDRQGFLSSLHAGAPDLDLRNRKVVVLGAGGAAMAVTGALLSTGVTEIAIVNRSAERAADLCRRFGAGVSPVPWHSRNDALTGASLLVNTTSLGMTGQPKLELNISRLPQDAVVADIVYTPLVTPLLVEAAQRGNVIVPGLGMLLHQAVRGFELWFGVRPTVTDELYDLVATDVDPGYRR